MSTTALAHPAALQLQSSLIAGRYTDVIEWPVVGRIDWATAVELLDCLLMTAWAPDPPEIHRHRFERIERELECEVPLKGSGHDGLLIAAWALGLRVACT